MAQLATTRKMNDLSRRPRFRPAYHTQRMVAPSPSLLGSWETTSPSQRRITPRNTPYEEVGRTFSETEAVRLTLATAQINTWNRIAIVVRAEPGEYQPQTHAKGRTHINERKGPLGPSPILASFYANA